MIYQNVELHNVAQITEEGEGRGVLLHRMPTEAEAFLNPGAAAGSRNAAGCEIRFVIQSGEKVVLRLAADVEAGANAPVALYDGSFQSGYRKHCPNLCAQGTEVVVERTGFEKQMMDQVAAANPGVYPFSVQVMRILLPNAPVRILSIEGDCRPPKPQELPACKCLCYGSSITNGCLATARQSNYCFRLGEILGWDTLNQGYSGSARLEDCAAQYLAHTVQWDVATLEMGINMIDFFTAEEFETIAAHFVETIARANPQKNIYCIDMFYSHNDFHHNPLAPAFRRAVKRIVEQLAMPKLHYIDGRRLLGSVEHLTGDVVHPDAVGHDQIARRLARILKSAKNA